MKQFHKIFLAVFFLLSLVVTVDAQKNNFWRQHLSATDRIIKDKSVQRLSFPTEFKLFDLDIAPLQQELLSIVNNRSSKKTTIISLPNADGQIEEFEVYEASNFEPTLQVRFPDIRAYSGKGVTDKHATLKLSLSPQGIQTMVFRTEKANEFIEAYSADHSTYAVFYSQRRPGQLPWKCYTPEEQLSSSLNAQVGKSGITNRSGGNLKTMRLAQSVTAEYSNYFGATSSAQVGLVLAAINATLTRSNGCYEKDLALHLNLIDSSTYVIYYNAATDPYSAAGTGAGGAWNLELQKTLTSVLGNAKYDIGHLFGASGGGGNAGCIGCVCVNPANNNDTQKGSGYTSPADAIPQGDNFDIDYVVHEVGHQLGANHTFSHSLEGTGVNKEVGSGITIMGYAGITSQDVAAHSIDIYHEASIDQIQTNLATKSCPITTSLAGTNATPVVAAVSNYIIPKSTPFALTGSATDADGDALTYCWEQNDNSTTSGANSKASITKTTGPNFLSFKPTVSPTRYFPKIQSILAGKDTTGPIMPGATNGITIEALSSVARTLNFRLTVRDNSPYSSTPPIKVGQTEHTDMAITVNATAGPFTVTAPNGATAGVTWTGGSSQTVTWNVASTTASPINCANVNILLSTDGGYTFPTVLVANTPNDGTESVTIPNVATTTARIKVESVGNIFFNISRPNNFTITATTPNNGFTFTPASDVNVTCGSAASPATLQSNAVGGFNTPITLTYTSSIPGTTVSFGTNPLTPGNSTTVTLNNANTLAPGTDTVIVTGVAGAITQKDTILFVIQPGSAPVITTQPTNQTVCAGANATFTSASSTGGVSYQWQVSTNSGSSWSNVASGGTSASYTVNSTTSAQNNYQYRVIISTLCGTITSNAATLTVNTAPAISVSPASVSVCAGSSHTFSSTATGTNLTYQWQVSTNGGSSWSNVASGGTSATYQLTGITLGQNGYQYHVVVSGTCTPSATSAAATLTVSGAPSITTQPSNVTQCAGTNATFGVTASGSGLTYQWQVNTGGGFANVASGGTSASYTVNSITAAQNNYQYQVVVSGAGCATPTTSSAATLTVNTLPAVTTQPTNQTVCAGATATFTAAATGTNIAYQWQVNTGSGFTNVASGGNAASYTTAATTAGQSGYQYQVVVSGTCTPNATSSAATLTVNTLPAITTQPTAQTVCAGASVTFTAAATGTGITYQWQENTGGGFNNISGANGASYTINPTNANQNGNQYQVVVSGTCTPSATSSSALLTVNSLPVINISGDHETNPNQTITLNASSNPTLSTCGWLLNGSPISGSASSSYNVNESTPGLYPYAVSVTDVNGCTSVSDTFLVRVRSLAFIYPNPTTTGQFNISYEGFPANSKAVVTVFDSKGSKVYAAEFAASTSNYVNLLVNVRKLSRGTYMVILSDANGKKYGTGKVVVD